MLDLRKTGGALQTECNFQLRYTKFEIGRRPKQGDALQTEGAHTIERIRYVGYSNEIMTIVYHSLYR